MVGPTISVGSRTPNRIKIAASALTYSISHKHQPPGSTPRRILVAHNLLLGDTIMLAALFATLRARYPDAEIYTTVNPFYLPLFSNKPYGVIALPYNPRDNRCISELLRQKKLGGFDLACVPGDNRYALLARSMGARWIVALAGDVPEWKNLLCDAEITWPAKITALPECFARMAGIPDPRMKHGTLHYQVGDWPAPTITSDFTPPDYDYVILHVGARSPLRRWHAQGWSDLAKAFADQGLTPIWSAGPGEEDLLKLIDPVANYPGFLGNLSLAELWQLFASAKLIVCPDTGVSHLAKLIGAPTLCLYGPGAPQIVGSGVFFSSVPFVAVGALRFPCRNQKTLFRRKIAWVSRCQRNTDECQHAKCMDGITTATILSAAKRLLSKTTRKKEQKTIDKPVT